MTQVNRRGHEEFDKQKTFIDFKQKLQLYIEAHSRSYITYFMLTVRFT